jgi:predicted MFS family arabinose efflux permease
VIALATAGWLNTAVGLAAALTGPLAYLCWGRVRRSRRRAEQ